MIRLIVIVRERWATRGSSGAIPVLLPVFVALLFATACGSSPSAPTPTPIPVPLPTPTPTPAPSVPLPTTDPRFDLAFYNQLVHNTYDAPGSSVPLQRLTASPRIYLQRTGLSDAFVGQLEQTARETLPAFTGGAITVAGWDTGTDVKPDTAGWIVVQLRADNNATCGLANVGLSAGHIWLNTVSRCQRNGEATGTALLFKHELGHALGFHHVDQGLMNPTSSDDLSDRERFHGAVAYQQPVGSVN